jgi:NAD(P)-dependent dehydrogenase (short-subunit alcohol dehydrogenase family)
MSTPRVALITGGMGAIGFAIARRLARGGMLPVLADRDATRLEEGVASLRREFGVAATSVTLDLTELDAPARVMEAVGTAHGRLDVLVNNAGLSRGHRIETVTQDEWEAVFTINLTVPMRLCQAATPFFRAQSYGRIVNMSSRTWVSGSGPAYTASKAGLVGLTRSLAVQLGPLGVTANAVAPSYLRTAFNHVGQEEARADAEKQNIRMSVVGRLCEPEDVAAAVAFFASEEASFITGEVLHVAGGSQLAPRPGIVAWPGEHGGPPA